MLGLFGLCNLLKSKEKREKKTIHAHKIFVVFDSELT
jgi:hypothetical protein